MKKRNRILLAGLVVAVIGVVVWMAWPEPPNPVYAGRPLSIWLIDAGNGVDAAKSAQARDAIQQLGTKAIPFFLSKVRQKDSRLIIFAAKWNWSRKYFEDMTERQFKTTFCDHIEAQIGFAALTPKEAEETVSPLLKLLDDSDYSVRQCALGCLALLRLEELARGRVSAEIAKLGLPSLDQAESVKSGITNREAAASKAGVK